MKKTILLPLLVLGSAFQANAAVVLASWQYPENVKEGSGPVDATGLNMAVTSAVMTRASGLVDPSPTLAAWETNGTNETSAADAQTNNDYYQVILTPASGQTLSLTSVDTSIESRGAGTIIMTAFTFDNSTWSSAIDSDESAVGPNDGVISLDLSGATQLQNFTSAVTLRFTVHKTGNSDGYHELGTEDNLMDLDFAINGNVVPEPSTALLGCLALGGLALLRRR